MILNWLSFFGLAIGLLLAILCKEELKSSKKYFLLFEKICLLVIFVILMYSFKLKWTVLLGIPMAYFFKEDYFYLGLSLLSNNFLVTSFVFMFGLPNGSLLYSDKVIIKKVLMNLLLFLIPAIFLLNVFVPYQEYLISFAIGALLIRTVNIKWKLKN
ncbi:MAG: hypothetical protein PHD81_04995 [Candidatus Nanoarchaeia archaeon]|nr:hypothetical protein [Candidatus Nanoarchaeia archaeon]MDD5588435.1 hypothetical protein [Candidatus Nanoarchaeia archaeon]